MSEEADMTEYTKRVIIIVTAGQANAANAQAKLVDTGGGEFAWTARLSPDGLEPASHLWCNWQMKPSDFDSLIALLAEIPGHNEQVFELDSPDPAIARPTPDEILDMTTPKLKVVSSVE